MSRSRYLVGIDLGTTNCAVAYVDTHGRERPSADIRNFEVPQLVAPGETAPRPMLPSFLYLPGEHELPPGATRLPWNEGSDRIVGEFARSQGAKVPSRLVSSAKSWLCHAGIDREADILPWGSPPEVKKVSPVEASASYLRHIRDAWNDAFAQGDPSKRLENQEVVLTVPASFDEAARELTIEAAKRAELATITLLEEPQAAFYCWIVSHQDRWQREVRAGELILVCDIGGGTTDFSLITVVETPTGPGFRRVAVGDHLMLGGDNIDLALAHHVEKKLGGPRLDAEQWSALRFACRTAKEKLLGEAAGGHRALAGHDRRPRLEADRRQHPVGADARRGRGDRARRFLRPRRAGRRPGAGGQERLAGVRAAVRRRSGRSQAPELFPAQASRRGDRARGPPAGRSARAARRDPVQRRGAHARDRPPADRRGDRLVVQPTIPGRRSCRACSPIFRSTWPWPRGPPITESSGAAAASGSAAGRPGRFMSGSKRPPPTSPGSASCRATPRRARRSRSPATISTS